MENEQLLIRLWISTVLVGWPPNHQQNTFTFLPDRARWFYHGLPCDIFNGTCIFQQPQKDRTVGNLGIMKKTSSMPYGGFHKWGYPNSWMVYKGKAHLQMDDLGVPPFMETPPIENMFLSRNSRIYELWADHPSGRVIELRQVCGTREGVEVSDCWAAKFGAAFRTRDPVAMEWCCNGAGKSPDVNEGFSGNMAERTAVFCLLCLIAGGEVGSDWNRVSQAEINWWTVYRLLFVVLGWWRTVTLFSEEAGHMEPLGGSSPRDGWSGRWEDGISGDVA